MVELRWGAATDRGRVRPENEDTFIAEPMIFAVADGMGGHQAGEVASALASSILRERLGNGAASESAATAAVEEANAAIYGAARANSNQAGMGTTLTALAVLNADVGHGSADRAEERLALLNVGDSRTYRFRLGRLQRMTVDHSYVQELVATGVISDEEARTHPRRNIVTRALGIDSSVRADVWSLPIVLGDRFILCSDGLVDEVPDHEISDLVGAVADPQRLAEQLVDMANRHGGRDNITVVVVDVLSGDAPPDPTDEIAFDPAWAEGVEEPTAWADDATVGVDADPDPDADTDPSTDPNTDPVHIELPTAAMPLTEIASPALASAPTSTRRRRLTLGTFIFTFLFALIATVTVTLIAVHERSGYFVGFSGDTVVVFKGQRDPVLWFNPTVAATSTKTRQDLDPTMVAVVDSRPTFDSVDAAAQFIANQVTTNSSTTTTTTTTTTTISTGTTTTAVTSSSVAGP